MECKKPLIPFKAGSPMMVVGPTNCGKTFWINRLLENDMFTQKAASVLFCYGVYQDYYETMRENPNIIAPITFHEGLPSKETIDHIADGRFHIIILDDLMEQVVKSLAMQELFTKHCHHKNMTALMVSQNVFQKGPNARTISLNSHVQVLFANKRDESQIAILANQLYRVKSKKKRFLAVFDDHMKSPYAYLVIDCTPDHPADIKVRAHIFPGELTCTFSI
jgi:hypothetical protein